MEDQATDDRAEEVVDKTQKILDEVKRRFNRSKDHTESQYRIMKEDLEFLNGEQWDQNLRSDRQADSRPCLTINKLPAFLDQIVGDQRMNRPSIKIKPVGDGADKDTAEILTGLIRNIESQSNAPAAYDTGFDAAASCGFGAWRVITDYIDPLSFEQEIKVIPVDNQFTVYLDPNAKEWDQSDAEYQIITEMMVRSAFERQFPDSDLSMFESERDNMEGWTEGEKIRVAEYYVKEYEKKTIYLVQIDNDSPITVDKDDLEKFDEGTYKVLKERETRVPKIKWYRVSGASILEGPIDHPSKYFPVIPVWGKKINIENVKHYRGMVRNAKDPQRLYNYTRSMGAEAVALAPRAPFLMTPKQINNFEGKFKLANKKNFAYLLYNPDQMAPPPMRQPGVPGNVGIQQEVLISDQELHDTTGLQQSNMGKSSNEKSGKAIMARQREGDVGSFDYTNSLINALMHTGKVVLDLIPKIYDTARTIRILGEDGEDSVIPINQHIEQIERAFDLTVGRYDVVISTGPSFSTQREETKTSMMEFIQYAPDAAPLVMDLVAKNMDWPGADEFSERLKPPGQEDPTPEQIQEQMLLREAEKRTMLAKTKQEELKAEKLELENVELATNITDKEVETAQKIISELDNGQDGETKSE